MCPYIFDSFVDNMLTNKQYRAVESINCSRESNEPTGAISAPMGQHAYCRNHSALLRGCRTCHDTLLYGALHTQENQPSSCAHRMKLMHFMLLQDILRQVMGNQTPGQLYTNSIEPAARDHAQYANVIKRFLDVVSQLVGMGFHVILDCHLQQDKLTQVRLRASTLKLLSLLCLQ
jgi:hypothetical protein